MNFFSTNKINNLKEFGLLSDLNSDLPDIYEVNANDEEEAREKSVLIVKEQNKKVIVLREIWVIDFFSLKK